MNELRSSADEAHLISGLTTGFGGVGWFDKVESGEMVSYAEVSIKQTLTCSIKLKGRKG